MVFSSIEMRLRRIASTLIISIDMSIPPFARYLSALIFGLHQFDHFRQRLTAAMRLDARILAPPPLLRHIREQPYLAAAVEVAVEPGEREAELAERQ
ncbi:hypothetical protein WJ68_16270 [Burkholderia ubonensis]|uniref:Uncharacterized protein n=1 Tax=Burkholderia ubonensis TaxID=101571 RepID=A0ABD4DZP5_9BURK|nr:hypothetical protein WJ68_16270 [Burkholderia ubonensis]